MMGADMLAHFQGCGFGKHIWIACTLQRLIFLSCSLWLLTAISKALSQEAMISSIIVLLQKKTPCFTLKLDPQNKLFVSPCIDESFSCLRTEKKKRDFHQSILSLKQYGNRKVNQANK